MSITAPVGEDVGIASINAGINYTMWSVFATRAPLPADDRERSELVAGAQDAASSAGVTVRGWYDVAGLRADADLMVWWHAPSIEHVQSAYRNLLSSPLGPSLTRVWSGVALHRPAEFNKAHVPAYLAGDPPGLFMCVYPFVRSYDWYLLPAEHRRQMLADHGSAARDYPDVRANTVAAFALGDYEWILSLESNELHRLVDLMRELRGTEARRYVREEVPFFTGTRTSLEDWIDRQPRA